MFKRSVQPIADVLNRFLRQQGLETPLLQKRIVDAWPSVVGPNIDKYCEQPFIKNQTLFVKVSNPALRQDLSMMRGQLVKRLNDAVGSMVITDIRVF